MAEPLRDTTATTSGTVGIAGTGAATGADDEQRPATVASTWWCAACASPIQARIPRPDPGPRRASPGSGTAPAWPAGARRRGSRCPPAPDRFAAGEKWLREVIDGRGRPGRGQAPRLGAGRVRQLHLRRLRPTARCSSCRARCSAGTAQATRGSRRLPRTARTPGSPAAASLALLAPGHIRWHDGSLSAPEWEQAVGAAVRADHPRRPAQGGARARHLRVGRRADRRAGAAAPAGRPVPGLLHVRLRRPGGRHARAARSAGTAAR